MWSERLSEKRWGRRGDGGFTLVEVALAVVVGLLMIAAVTMVYNQAKASAGNSRAMEKVSSLQTLIESYLVTNSGLPTIAYLRTLWAQQRPDDYDASPWGGASSPTTDFDSSTSCSPTGSENGILWGNCLSPDGSLIGSTGCISNSPVGPVSDALDSGSLIFYDLTASPSTSPGSVFGFYDNNLATFVPVRNYALASTDSDGTRWLFVTGGAALGGDVSGCSGAHGHIL